MFNTKNICAKVLCWSCAWLKKSFQHLEELVLVNKDKLFFFVLVFIIFSALRDLFSALEDFTVPWWFNLMPLWLVGFYLLVKLVDRLLLGLVLLFVFLCPLFMSVGLDAVAEQLSIIAYFFLWFGVGKQVWELYKQK